MPGYSVVLCDLDGTLSDPKEGITHSVQYALRKMAVASVPQSDELTAFIGPPLHESFMCWGLTESEAWRAVTYYREYFSVHGLYENYLYPRVRETLERLAHNQIALWLATSKPTGFSEQILEFFGLRSLFTGVVGSDFDGTGAHKVDVLQKIVEKNSGLGREHFLMVGDHEQDILAASRWEIDCAAVEYGYGLRTALHEAHPTYWIKRFDEIYPIVMGNIKPGQ
ncbi:HAD hydrolase-like protein [Sulfobacillus thermosulfidooxidans]|uniref:HAD hydrolase-like protein n=1 Tax=Sulfobacillus thermosulfidooxidans TaxID=28034 RepID=UPI0006B5E93A|nr:HAD hydrolase-like protein [Sulfobacillus thermosulfidooxidans]